MADAHANFAISTVATAPSPASSGTSLSVASGEGSRFPAVPFNASVWPADAIPTPANAEIVRVTARTSDSFGTIVRAQESSSARSIVVGDRIMAGVTAKTLTDIETLAGDVTGAVGANTVTRLSQIVTQLGTNLNAAIWASAGVGGLTFNYNHATNRLVDTAVPGWSIRVDPATTDSFIVQRAPATAGAPTFATVFTISSAGVITPATLIKNAQIDAAAAIAGSKLDLSSVEYAFSTYKVVRGSAGNLAAGTAANTFVFWPGGIIAGLGTAGTVAALFKIDPADFPGGTRTAKMVVRGRVITNAVAPGVTFTFHLYPLGTLGGASGVRPSVATVGASVGSVAIATPGASAVTGGDSAAFTVPAAGYYLLAMVTSGTTAANSSTDYGVELLTNQV